MGNHEGIKNVFFSYGHDKNSIVVDQLAKDLISQEFHVWIDKNNLKAGDYWRKEITDAILDSELTIAFASEHSVRSPGVCLDELSIAINIKTAEVLSVRLEQDICLPANITERQYVDMSDWAKHYDPVSKTFDPWYDEKLQEILQVLNSPEVKQFNTEIEFLRKKLNPHLSDAIKDRFSGETYYGRDWLDQELTQQLKDFQTVLVVGPPGVGKSAFVANRFLSHNNVAAAIYCKSNTELNNPDAVLRLLIFRLCLKIPDYRSFVFDSLQEDDTPLSSVDRMAQSLLAAPLARVIDGDRRKMLILIDGLDEVNVTDENGRIYNPLAIAFSSESMQQIRRYFKIVLTSRPDPSVLECFHGKPQIIIKAHSKDNLDDIRAFLRKELSGITKEMDNSTKEAYIEKLCEQSEGIFLYVSLFVQELKDGIRSIADEDFPSGLYNFYVDSFRRKLANISTEYYESVLLPPFAILSMLKSELPESTFLRACLPNRANKAHFYRTFGAYITKANGTVRIFHKSLIDWLLSDDNDYYGLTEDDLDNAEHLLTNSCFASFKRGISSMNDFEMLYLVPRLQNSENYLNAVLPNGPFLMELAKRGQNAVLEYDYTRARKFSGAMKIVFELLDRPGRTIATDFTYASFRLNALLIYCCITGKLWESKGNLPEARLCYEKGISALGTESGTPDWKNVAQLYSFYAFCFYRLSDSPSAAEQYIALEQFILKQAPHALEMLLDAKIDLARTHRVQGVCTSALDIFKEINEAPTFCNELERNPRLHYKKLLHEGWTYCDQSNYDQANRVFDDAEVLRQKTQEDAQKKFGKTSETGLGTIAINDIGMVRNVEATLFLRQGNHALALEKANHAIRIFKRLHGAESLNICDFYNKKGMILKELADREDKAGNASLAADYYRQAEGLYTHSYAICDNRYKNDDVFYMTYPIRPLIYIKLSLKKDLDQVLALIEREDRINQRRIVTDESIREKEQVKIENDKRHYDAALEELHRSMEKLVWEVFEQEERSRTELRLTTNEVTYLTNQYNAVCEEMNPSEATNGYKRWYIVQMP